MEKALLYNDKKFPPMLPRVLRVSRAKHSLANASRTGKSLPRNTAISTPSGIYQPKLSSKYMSLSGRAKKLLGNAGAANLSKSPSIQGLSGKVGTNNSIPAGRMVFEGVRASRMQSMETLKPGGSGKKHGKPRTRSSRRGAAFRASGGKKSRKS